MTDGLRHIISFASIANCILIIVIAGYNTNSAFCTLLTLCAKLIKFKII